MARPFKAYNTRNAHSPNTMSILGRSPLRPRLKPAHFLNANRMARSVPKKPTSPELRAPAYSYGYHDEATMDYRIREDSDSDDDPFEWDEEETLVAALLREDPRETSEHDEMVGLTDKLKTSMSSKRQNIRAYLDVLVPAVNLVIDTSAILDNKVDLAFGEGLITFDDACKKMEAMIIRDEDALTAAYTETKTNIETLFADLEGAYARRGKLWAELQLSINESGSSFHLVVSYFMHRLTVCNLKAERALTELNEIPVKIERKISALEKQRKEMEKENLETAKAQDKMLKEFFSKYA